MLFGTIVAGLAIGYVVYKEVIWNKRWNELQKRYMNVIDSLFVNATNKGGYEKNNYLRLLMAANQDTPVGTKVNEGDLLEGLVKESEEGKAEMEAFINQQTNRSTQKAPGVG